MWFSTHLYLRFSFCCHSFLLYGSNDAVTRKGSTFIFVTLIYFDTIPVWIFFLTNQQRE
ncbi:hypothetical protein LDENG_00171060, partial [Lucifuga dentata]